MKLVSFEVSYFNGRRHRVGVFNGNSIIDITTTYAELLNQKGCAQPSKLAHVVSPPNMLEFLQMGDRALEAAEECLSAITSGNVSAETTESQLVYDREEVELLSPLPRPNSIRDCAVYEEHLLNCRNIEPGSLPEAYYKYPVYYKGNPDAIVHPGQDVIWPNYTNRFDFELEIAAIIGKQGRDIHPADANQYIIGFTIFNDFSARDIQGEAKPVMMGPSKSKDFANGFGPCLITADSIDPADLRTVIRVNDEVWSEGTTDGMYHSWEEILAHISEGVTVYPGDIIGSGTVARGCGLEIDKWLQPGDTIELEVEEIGSLQHEIIKPN